MAEQKHVIDTFGPVEFLAESVAEFGGGAIELYGWLLMLGATGGRTRAEMVKRLVGFGVHRTTVYKAIRQVERLAVRLYTKRDRLDELPDFSSYGVEISDLAEHMASVARRVDLREFPSLPVAA